MSDLKIGQTQAFTVAATDGSAVVGIAVAVSDPTLASVAMTGDAAFSVTALAEGAATFTVSAPGFKAADPFTLNMVPLPQLVVTPGAVTGP